MLNEYIIALEKQIKSIEV